MFKEPEKIKKPIKKLKFSDEIETKEFKPDIPCEKDGDGDETDLDVENLDEVATSSDITEDAELPTRKINGKSHSDAILQTDIKVKMVSQETQTDESMLTRPLNDNEQQRVNSQAYFALYRIPKPRAGGVGGGPPLKIGLTLRGKKRKVFYPRRDSNLDDRRSDSD